MLSYDRILFYQGICRNDQIRNALISVSVESALLDNGIETYERVAQLLDRKYHSSMTDCHNHPRYLNEILHTFHENLRYRIIKSIRKELGEFSYDVSISKFLNELNM